MFMLLYWKIENMSPPAGVATALQRLMGFRKNINIKQQLANNISARTEKTKRLLLKTSMNK